MARVLTWLLGLGVGSLSLVGADLALAQQASNASLASSGAKEVDEVLVTLAPYRVAESGALANVDVLRQGKMDLKAATGLGDMVAGLPGVRSSSFAPGASRPVIRGMQGQRVQVLSNGLGMVDASALSPDHAVPSDPATSSRIEILRGPSTLIYGGNAIGGVVNVIDDRIATSPTAKPLEGRLVLQGASVDQSSHVAASIKAGRGPWVLSLDGVSRDAKDFRVPVGPESRRLTDQEGEAPDKRKKVPNSFSRLNAFGAGLTYVGDWGLVGLAVKQTDNRYGVPVHQHGAHDHDHDHGDGDDHDHDHDHGETPGHDHPPVTIRLKQTRYDFRSDVKLGLSWFSEAKLKLGYADYTHTEFEGKEASTRFKSTGFEGRLDLVQVKRGNWVGAVGFSGLDRKFEAAGEEAYVPTTTIRELGLFTVQRYETGTWGVEGGLRADQRELKTARQSREFSLVSASIGGFVRPTENSFLGLTLARNGRAPSEAELFANGAHPATGGVEVGDARLKAEQVTSLELTGHYQVGKWSFDGHVYTNRFDGYIDLRPTGQLSHGLPVYAYRQTGAEFQGFELTSRWRAFDHQDLHVSLEGAIDQMRGQTDLGKPARMPNWTATARTLVDYGAWSGSFEVVHVAEQDRVAQFELPSDAYTLCNLFISVRPLKDKALVLFAEGRNLGDVEAREHVSFLKDRVPLPGRNFRAGISYRF